MRIVDPHIQMYARTTDDYEQMALAGIESSANGGPADVLSVPRVANQLLRAGFPREEVERLVFWNPLRSYPQSASFRLPDGVSREQLGVARVSSGVI